MRIRRVLFFIVLFSIEISFGQKKIAEVLKKSADAYINAVDFSANVRVVKFKTKDQKIGDPLGLGLMIKSEDGYYSKFESDELIANKRCTVVINHFEKSIMYLEPRDLSKNSSMFSKMPSIDSLIKKNDSSTYVGVENGMEHLIFYSKKNAIRRIDLYLGVTDHFMRKLVYYYAPSDKNNDFSMYKMEITYENIKIEKVDKSTFSESKYIAYKRGIPILQSEFGKYKLVVAEKYKDHPLK